LNFGHVRHLHFVGIGGAGMCGLAELLHGEGLEVSGCDLIASETTLRLEGLGIPVTIGHSPDHLGETDIVVFSSAVSNTNPEVVEAHRRGLIVIKRAEMLGEISRFKWGIAIAGTHGKTTTTSLTGFILTKAGLDPTVVVGGRMHYLGAHARLGASEYLVCEADEFDRSFLSLYPVLSVINNIEAEHLDTYGDVKTMMDAYLTFARRVPFFGATIACIDDHGVRQLVPAFTRHKVTYGFSSDADVRAVEENLAPAGTTCTVVRHGQRLGQLHLLLPGRHMLVNALAATTIAMEVGIDFDSVAAAVAEFAGVARRFERKGERDGVVLVDDYAHHPTEVAVTLRAARQRFPDARLVVLFQPHLFSRTQAFAREFGNALLGADVALVLPIYPARERPIPGVTHKLVVDGAISLGHRCVAACDSFDDALTSLTSILRPGDVLITMGAGDVVRLGESWLAGGAP
jgi:UDP-N-acetylmuramate--alanine ligase